MRNSGVPQFSYEVLKSAYDSDPRYKELIKDFDKHSITLHTDDGVDQLDPVTDKGTDSVSAMAKRATQSR